MKINVKNFELFKNGGFKLSHKAKKGFIIAGLTVIFGTMYGLYLDSIQKSNTDDVIEFSFPRIEAPQIIEEDPINISLEEINSLNIIINDSDSSENFINEVCNELSRDCIKFSFAKNSENIDVDGAVVITLDQQYSAGPGTIIFAPYENNRLGNSDALALAAKTAFYENGFIVDDIICGKSGFKENENGTVDDRITTETEEAISKDRNSSFVTISFGTQNTNPSLVAASIENMLVRYYSYITDEYQDIDLIYRVEDGDSFESLSEKLKTTTVELITSYDKKLVDDQTIVNPNVENMRSFNKKVPINLYVQKTLWSR